MSINKMLPCWPLLGVFVVPILVNLVPPNSAMLSAMSGPVRQHFARLSKNALQTVTRQTKRMPGAQKPPGTRVAGKQQQGNGGINNLATEMPTMVEWQKIAPNLPSKASPKFGEIFRYYSTTAGETLKRQLELAQGAVQATKQTGQKVKKSLMFGLDQLPSGVQQNAHLPHKLVNLNQRGAVSRTMRFVGTRMYEGIWKMSNKLKELPPKTSAVLAAIFGYAEIAHTRDEWSQATLNALVSPDSVGFSLPRTMDEFNEGLVNAALDILPDFAFAVPVALFVANPPAAILWAGWMAVGEYFAKKSWSLMLRDVVLPTKSGGKFLGVLTDNHVPVERVFPKQEEDEEDGEEGAKDGGTNSPPIQAPLLGGADDDERNGNSGSTKETVSILDALSDSQVDSNLYQYLFMNTLRAYYVTATSIYSYFMDEIENGKTGEGEGQQQMTEFAKEMKQKMAQNEKNDEQERERKNNGEHGDKNSSAKSTNGQPGKFQWFIGAKLPAGEEKAKSATEIGLIENYVRVNTEPISTRWVDTITHFGRVMLDEMEAEEQQNVQELARGVAHAMVYKERRGGEAAGDAATQWHESMRTTAQLISGMSTSPDVLEELVKVKLGGDELPKCDRQNSPLLLDDNLSTAPVSEEQFFNSRREKICQMSSSSNVPATEKEGKAQQMVTFLPIVDDQLSEELLSEGLFKKKVKKVVHAMRLKKGQLGAAAKQKSPPPSEPDEQQQQREKAGAGSTAGWKRGVEKAIKAKKAADVLNKVGHENRMRQRHVFTRVTKISDAQRNSNKKGLALVRKK